MPVTGFYFPLIGKTQEGNNILFRFGTDNTAGIYAMCTDPLPSATEIRNILLTNPGVIRQNFATDFYRERKERNKTSLQKIVIDKRTKPQTPPTIEPMPVIKLGGEFLQIGGDDENVGGRNTKMG